MEIEDLRKLAVENKVEFSTHALQRMEQRSITDEDITEAIRTGKIIEDYPEDRPLPSCLILRSLFRGKPLHVVIGYGEDMLVVITAYYPAPELWDETFEHRREPHED